MSESDYILKEFTFALQPDSYEPSGCIGTGNKLDSSDKLDNSDSSDDIEDGFIDTDGIYKTKEMYKKERSYKKKHDFTKCTGACRKCFEAAQRKRRSSLIVKSKSQYNLIDTECTDDFCTGCQKCLDIHLEMRYDGRQDNSFVWEKIDPKNKMTAEEKAQYKIWDKNYKALQTHSREAVSRSGLPVAKQNPDRRVSRSRDTIPVATKDCLSIVAKLMSDDTFRDFFTEYFSTWSDARAVLMLMNGYVFIEETFISHTGKKPKPNDVLYILRKMMMNGDYRRIIRDSMLQFLDKPNTTFQDGATKLISNYLITSIERGDDEDK